MVFASRFLIPVLQVRVAPFDSICVTCPTETISYTDKIPDYVRDRMRSKTLVNGVQHVDRVAFKTETKNKKKRTGIAYPDALERQYKFRGP